MGLETALLATTIISAGVSAYGQYQEGQDAAQASRYNADIARQNADITRQNAELNAGMIEQSGALDASRQRKQVRRLVGTQKAGYAGAGVELTGSPLDVMINTSAEGELDAQIMEYNTKVKAISTRYAGASQAAEDERLASIYGIQAGNQERSGMFRAGSTLLTSASQIGSSYFAPSSSATKIGSYTGYRTSGGKPYGGY